MTAVYIFNKDVLLIRSEKDSQTESFPLCIDDRIKRNNFLLVEELDRDVCELGYRRSGQWFFTDYSCSCEVTDTDKENDSDCLLLEERLDVVEKKLDKILEILNKGKLC